MRAAQQPHETKRWVVLLTFVLLAILLVVMINRVVSSQSESAHMPVAEATNAPGPVRVQQPQEPDLREVEKHDPDDGQAVGSLDAPVTLVVFSDYQCPFCAKWTEETLPVLLEEVDNGQLRIEWRELSIFGPESEQAARASFAAGQQGAFLQMHHELYDDGEILPAADLGFDVLAERAGHLGLDGAKFVEDMHSELAGELMRENSDVSMSIGIFSTPAFIMNGTPIIGAQPAHVFLEAFNQAIENAK